MKNLWEFLRRVHWITEFDAAILVNEKTFFRFDDAAEFYAFFRGTVWEMKVISCEWIWYGQVHDFEQLIEEISDFFNQKISKNSFTVPNLIPQPPVSSSSFPYLLINDPLARSTSAGRFYFQLHYNAIKKSIIITAKKCIKWLPCRHDLPLSSSSTLACFFLNLFTVSRCLSSFFIYNWPEVQFK